MAMILTEKFLLPADADDALRQAIVRQWMRKRRAVLADASSLFAPEVHGPVRVAELPNPAGVTLWTFSREP
jgi:hypothetical protein